jgi:hypothetical protein
MNIANFIDLSQESERSCICVLEVMILSLYTPPPLQTKFGGYIGITLSVRPSMYLVSAIPPKRLIEFL